METATMIACRECSGTGSVPEFETTRGERETRCPWCGGSGEVERLYDVRSHGHNGDWSFTELEAVVTTLEEARAVARKAFDRNPETVRWCEVFGPDIDESIGIWPDGSEEGC